MKTETILTFLKLGGSLITDKSQPLTAEHAVITRLAAELATSRNEKPEMPLLIGHGSGSFGHAMGQIHNTVNGVDTAQEWVGFAEVWSAARNLNQIVITALVHAGLPVIAFPPSAGILSQNKAIESWDLQPLKQALSHHLIPVVQGDVVFDTALGGTIFSTEQVFETLAQELRPARILLAGADQGVYLDPQHPDAIVDIITPENYSRIQPALHGAESTDVTGGMLAKVEWMLSLLKSYPQLEIQIFSGATPGNLERALAGEQVGTRITSE